MIDHDAERNKVGLFDTVGHGQTVNLTSSVPSETSFADYVEEMLSALSKALIVPSRYISVGKRLGIPRLYPDDIMVMREPTLSTEMLMAMCTPVQVRQPMSVAYMSSLVDDLYQPRTIAWQRGDVRGHLAGPYARHGWASRCLDPATGLWETYRLTRRATRRQRGRARGAARLARLRAIS